MSDPTLEPPTQGPRVEDPARYRDELFTNDDGGGGTAWCYADLRDGAEAVSFAARFLGPFRTSVTANLVLGYVTDEGAEGLRFHTDADSEDEFWEIDGA